MKRNITELVFLLDRSGSMGGLEEDTIGGYNSVLKKQRKNGEDVYVSTILFDDRMETIHFRTPIKQVTKLTEDDYYTRGSTALLDAMGRTIKTIAEKQKEDDAISRPSKTLFVVTTDGMENSSRKFTYKDIRKLIRKQEEKRNWEFLFLGANMDAIEVASQMGIQKHHAVRFLSDRIGTKLNYSVLDKCVNRAIMCDTEDFDECFDDGAWKEEIESDFATRK